MGKDITNVSASVLAKLLNLHRESGKNHDLLLTRYVLERFLFRLSQSDYRDDFLLKGAMLIAAWSADLQRPTRDLDLLGFGDSSPEALTGVIKAICSLEAQDGVVFDTSHIECLPIAATDGYGGQRLKVKAQVGNARVAMTIDIGFGDSVEPGPEELTLPVLLEMPAPVLRGYAKETVIAEKFEAIVSLGLANTRLKDFYDIWLLIQLFDFSPQTLEKAIKATFERRGTELPLGVPDGLTEAFANDPSRAAQWERFLSDIGADRPELGQALAELRAFLVPIVAAIGH